MGLAEGAGSSAGACPSARDEHPTPPSGPRPSWERITGCLRRWLSSFLSRWWAVVVVAVLAMAAPARAEPCEPRITVTGHGSAAALADELAAAAPAHWATVRARLGLTGCAPVDVQLLPAIEGARDLEPPWQLPHWAAGAADPLSRRVVVAVTASRKRQDRGRVLLHELAHLGAREAAGGRPLPRWLDEGAARVIAGEHSSEDLSVLARARVGDSLIPLAALAEGFPHDQAHAALAYAEAGRAVSLLEGRRPDALASVLAAIAGGADVDHALWSVTGLWVWQLDGEVERSIPSWRAWAVVGREIDVALALAALVTAWAGLRARRQVRARLAAMPLEPAIAPQGMALVRWTVQRGVAG